MGKNSTKLGELGVSFSGIHSTTWVKNNDGMGWNGMVWYGISARYNRLDIFE